jgi:succinoglycan biosynthesis transport protein ExoP
LNGNGGSSSPGRGRSSQPRRRVTQPRAAAQPAARPSEANGNGNGSRNGDGHHAAAISHVSRAAAGLPYHLNAPMQSLTPPSQPAGAAPLDHLTLERVLATLRRRWWIIALLTVLATVAAFGISEVQRRQYTASTSVLFQSPQLSDQASGLQALNTSPSSDPVIMATNIQLLEHQQGVAAATAAQVGHRLTAKAVKQAISVAQEGQTNVAVVSATNPNPRLAAAIANAYSEQFIANLRGQQQASVGQALALVEDQIKTLSPPQLADTNGQALLDRAESLRILAALQDGDVQVITPASVPTAPSSPKVLRNTGIGLVLGLLAGIMAAFLLQRLDRRIRSLEDLEHAYQLPLLGTVPTSKVYTLAPAAAERADHGELEAFHLLRAYLRYFNVDRELRILLVSSAEPGDGKSTIARNLAQAAQQMGTQTLLLEADLRLPELAEHYGMTAAPGLSDLLIGRAKHESAVRQVTVGSHLNGSSTAVTLDVLTAGHPPPNPTELLESQAMAQTFAWAAENYELVVVDTPPLTVVADAISLLHRVDGVIVVAKLGKSRRDAAEFLRDRLLSINAPLLGVVANGVVRPGTVDGHGYGYGYGYGSKGRTRGRATDEPPVGVA